MLAVERSKSGKFWHVIYNGIELECCDTKKAAMSKLERYKSALGSLVS